MVTSCHNSHLGMLALQICNPFVSLVLGAPRQDAHMLRCPVQPAHVAHWVSFLARKLWVLFYGGSWLAKWAIPVGLTLSTSPALAQENAGAVAPTLHECDGPRRAHHDRRGPPGCRQKNPQPDPRLHRWWASAPQGHAQARSRSCKYVKPTGHSGH